MDHLPSCRVPWENRSFLENIRDKLGDLRISGIWGTASLRPDPSSSCFAFATTTRTRFHRCLCRLVPSRESSTRANNPSCDYMPYISNRGRFRVARRTLVSSCDRVARRDIPKRNRPDILPWVDRNIDAKFSPRLSLSGFLAPDALATTCAYLEDTCSVRGDGCKSRVRLVAPWF